MTSQPLETLEFSGSEISVGRDTLAFAEVLGDRFLCRIRYYIYTGSRIETRYRSSHFGKIEQLILSHNNKITPPFNTFDL